MTLRGSILDMKKKYDTLRDNGDCYSQKIFFPVFS